MEYEKIFRRRLDALKTEGRYRTFANIARLAGSFPLADRFNEATGSREIVTVWCSNDYLAMGEHPDVLRKMAQTIETDGAGAGGDAQYLGD